MAQLLVFCAKQNHKNDKISQSHQT